MNGVSFEDNTNKIHTFDDWGIFLSSFGIGMATPKTEYVDVAGGNGAIDLTDCYGTVFYNNRTLTMEFQALDDDLRFTDKLDIIIARLHGKKFKITADFDSLWYWNGRVEINKYSTSKRLGKIVVKAVCEPYKLKQDKTDVIHAITGAQSVVCMNARMDAIPTFKADANMTFTFNNVSYSLVANQPATFANVIFHEGKNTLNFTSGTGNVEIEYQEGTL